MTRSKLVSIDSDALQPDGTRRRAKQPFTEEPFTEEPCTEELCTEEPCTEELCTDISP